MMTVTVSKSKKVSVASFAAASKVITTAWERRSNQSFYNDATAGVIEQDGIVIANVSYNGRVWQGSDRMATGRTEIKV